MTTLTITMSASSTSNGGGALPSSVRFSPAGQITEPVSTDVTFKVDSSLLSYINDIEVTVTLTWQDNYHVLTNDDSLFFTIGSAGDHYSLSITSNLIQSGGGENGTTTSGDIIVR